MKKNKKELPTIDTLILENPATDPKVIKEARAQIKTLRKHGFGGQGYSLGGRRFRPLMRQEKEVPVRPDLPCKP